MNFQTPILFLVFNRPDTTARVFEQIRKIKPANLYIAADGPRKNIEGEIGKCVEVRNITQSNIDWNCEVKTLFRKENLGCKLAVSQAINWFFDHVEQGIILEDDCLADQSFFYYCEEMLHIYKNDEDILAINGCNFNYSCNITGSYFFSKYMNVWGWATWRRSARQIDYNMTSWNNKSKLYFLWTRLRNYFFDFDLDWFRYWKMNFDAISSQTLNTWDYQWQYYQLLTSKKTIVPTKNLVVNIGFGDDATHTLMGAHPSAKLKLETLQLPLEGLMMKKINLDYEEIAVKPVWHIYSRKQNHYYLFNFINSMPCVQFLRAKL